MKSLKKIIALITLFAMFVNIVAPPVLAVGEALAPYTVQNGIVEYKINKSDGRFTIHTADGIPDKSSDNDLNLLFLNKLPETSFTTFRIDGEDYVFGLNYGLKGGIVTQTTIDGYIAKTVWRINDVEITQKLTLISDPANPNVGNTKITYEVANGGDKAVNLGSRILLDTQLGSNDASPMIVGTTFVTNETEYSGDNMPVSWKSADEKFAPNVIAYGLLSGWQNIEPDRMVISHWESISHTAWDYTPDPYVNFTTIKNEYVSADSAVALYFNPTNLATGETRIYETFYGIGSLSDASGDANFNIQLTSPQKLTINNDKTGYNEKEITITVNLDNAGIESADLNNLVVKLGLSDELTIAPTDAMIKTITKLKQGETTSVIFKVIPTVQQSLKVAEYGVTVVYGDDGNYTESKKYIILPSIKGTPPSMQMTEIAPQTIYTGANKKSVVIKGSEFSSLKADNEWSMNITNTRTGVSQEISRSNIYVEDATVTIQLDSLKFEAGEYDITLNSKNFGNMSKTITMTDDEKFDRMEYGLLLIGAFGTYNTDNPVYTTKVLKTEKDMETLSAEDQESILLTIRGEISSYDLSGVTVYECESGTIINNSIMYTSPISKPESTMLICRYDGVEGWSGANSFFDNFEWFGKDNESLLMSGEGTLSIGDYKFHYGNFNVTLEDGTKYGLGEPGPVDYNQDVNENVGEVDREDEDSPVIIVTPANVIANEVFKPIGALSGVKINIKNAVIGKSTVSLGGSFSVALPWLSDDDDSGSGSNDSKKSSSFDKINELDDYQGKDSLVALNMEEMRYGVNDTDNTSELVGVKADGSINLTDDTIPMLKAGGAKAGFKINSIDYPGWFVEVSAGVKVASAFKVNALVSLVFETGGECIPDCIELVVGGDIIKIPLGVTPMQVGWLNKMGGGIYNLYDTIKGNFNAIPPIALKVITGYKDPTMVALEIDTISMKISLGGIRFEAEKGKIVKLPLLESMYAGFQIYDTKYEGDTYVCIDIGAGIKMNLLDIIKGESSIWLVADPRINSVFGNVSLGGKMYCGLFIPSFIPLLGGMELAAIMAELSSYRVYAGIRIIGIPLSIGYYWADKEVKFNDAWDLANQLNIPQDEIDNALAIESSETDTNADGVMLFGGNLRKTYCSADDELLASNSNVLLASTNNTLFASNPQNSYSFDVNNQAYGLFELKFDGKMPNIKVKKPDGGDYELIENENYIVQTISADVSKSGIDENYVYISVVDPMNGKWTVETDTPVTLTAMDVLELPEVKNVSCEKQGDDKLKVDWNAMNIDDGDYTVDIHISEEQVTDAVYNENMSEEELNAYYKEMADSYDVGVCVAQDIKASDKSAIVDISERLKDGNYQARVVLKKSGENLSSALSSNAFTYVNPNTPDAVTNLTAVPGGDGQFKLNFDGVDDVSGYYIMIVDENGNAIEGFDGMTTTDTKVYVGNTYEQATGYDENEKPTGFETVGIFPGSNYKVHVYAYNVKDSITYMSEVVTTDTIYLPEPNPAEVGITVGGITPTSAMGDVKEVTVNTAIPDIALTSNQDVKMIYKVDREYVVDSENQCVEYEMKANTPLTIKEELLEGGSNFEFYFVNAQGDYTTEKISVSVDTIPPTLMLNKTVFESKNGDYVITGTAESNSVVYINDEPIVTSNGSFNYVGSGNNKREEISVKAVDCANNETIMLCEVIPSELSSFVSIKIKADGNEISEEFKIKKEFEAQLTVYGVAENGREYLLDNYNVSFSVVYGNDKISIDEDGVLKADYYGDGVIMCEYSVTDNYSFEESLPVKVLSLETIPTTIRVSNTDIDSSAKIGDVVALLSVPQSPIGVNYVYSVSDNEYVKIVDNKLVLKSQKLSESNITVTITAQGQHVLNGMYEDIYEPIEKEVTFRVTDSIVSADVLDSILVEKGVSFDSLDLPQTTMVTLSDNSVEEFPIAWQEGAYNQSVARVYTLKGDIQRNEDVRNPDEVVALMQVSVNKLSIEKTTPEKLIYGYTLPVATRPITVTNEGTTDLTVSSIEVIDVKGNPNDKFKVSIKSSIVSAGRTVEIAAIQPVAGLDAGVYNAKVIVTYGNNFKTEEDVIITVAKAPLIIKADKLQKTYKEQNPEATVTYDGFVNGEDKSVLNEKLKFVFGNVETDAVGTYSIKVSGLTSNNYDIKYVDGTLTVNPIKVNMNATGSTNQITLKFDNNFPGITLGDVTIKKGETVITPTFITANPNNTEYYILATLSNHSTYTITVIKDNCEIADATFTAIKKSSGVHRTPAPIEDIVIENPEDKNPINIDDVFSDISTHWAKESIKYVYEKDLFKGVTENSFEPDKTMTRGMVVTALSRLSSDDMNKYTQSNFKDASIDEWYGKSVAWATENNIANGVSDSEFVPNEDISREQLVVMIKNYADYIGIDTKSDATLDVYMDNNNVSPWAMDAMKWAVSAGIINGKENNPLNPLGKATRGEVATILMRFVENFIK